MSLISTQQAPHRRAHGRAGAAGTGQFTGALLILGGATALALGHLAGAWAGLTGLVLAGLMLAGLVRAGRYRPRPRAALAVAGHARPGERPGAHRALPGQPGTGGRPGG